jgi:hypothetical protein
MQIGLDHTAYTVGCITVRNSELWEPKTFIIDRKHACSFLQREVLALSSMTGRKIYPLL